MDRGVESILTVRGRPQTPLAKTLLLAARSGERSRRVVTDLRRTHAADELRDRGGVQVVADREVVVGAGVLP
jgi:hypothetical protein